MRKLGLETLCILLEIIELVSEPGFQPEKSDSRLRVFNQDAILS